MTEDEKKAQKYRKCSDCPHYMECFKTADLRKKRRKCGLADLTRKKEAEA